MRTTMFRSEDAGVRKSGIQPIWIVAAALTGIACAPPALAPAGPRTVTARTQQSGAVSPTATPYIWRNVEIVGGGFVSGILFHPKQRDLIYARTDIGGAYRWNPGTRRWVPLLDWLPRSDWNLYGIESVGLDPTDANRLYLAAGTYTNDWAGNGAMLRSTDQGRTWRRTDMPFKLGGNEDGRSIGERLAVDPGKNSILYFGSRHNGLWKSADYAATWQPVTSFPIKGRTNGIGIGFVLFDNRNPGTTRGGHGKPPSTIYVGVAAPGINLYRSTDGGGSWEAVAGQPAGLLPHHGALASNGALYLSYGNGPGPNGMSDGAVWKYDTKTGVWTNITPVAPGSGGMGNFGYAGLTVDAAHPNTVMVATMDKWSSGDDVYRSTDGGAHWASLKAQAVRDSSGSPFLNWGGASAAFGHWIGALAVDPFRPGHLLYGTGATIWGSDDVTLADAHQPTHWTVRAQGLEETAVLDLLSPSQGAHLLTALGDIGGFRHDDLTRAPANGMVTNPLLSNTDSLDCAALAPLQVARVGRGDDRLRQGAVSVDGGATWAPFGSAPVARASGGSVAVAADGHNILWAPSRSAPFATTDRGTTWTPCAGVPTDARVVADRVDPHRFYALAGHATQLWISTDDGATFAAGAQGLPGEHGPLRATPEMAGDLWLPCSNGLYHSRDAGRTFTRLASVQQAETMGFGKAAPGSAYPTLFLLGKVGGADGIYRSDDAGATWTHLDDAAHQYATRNTIIGDPRIYGRVYLGTNGRGVLYGDPAPITK